MKDTNVFYYTTPREKLLITHSKVKTKPNRDTAFKIFTM